MAKPSDLIGSKEAAHVLGVDRSTVTRLVARGELTGFRIVEGAKQPLLFRRSDVERLAARRERAS